MLAVLLLALTSLVVASKTPWTLLDKNYTFEQFVKEHSIKFHDDEVI